MTEGEKRFRKITHVEGPWINLQSKSHLGRAYYFNTVTGEAVWNLAEAESSQKNSISSQSQDELSDDNLEIKSPNYEINETENSEKPTMQNQEYNDFHTNPSYNTQQNVISYNPNIWDVPPPMFTEQQAINNKMFQNVTNANNSFFSNLNGQNNINNTMNILGQSMNRNNFPVRPLIGNLPPQTFMDSNTFTSNLNSKNFINQSSQYYINSQQMDQPNQYTYNINNLSGYPVANINNVPILPNLRVPPPPIITSVNKVSNSGMNQSDSNIDNNFNINQALLVANQADSNIELNIPDDNFKEELYTNRFAANLLSNKFKLLSESRIDTIPRVVRPYRRKSICVEISESPEVPNKKHALDVNDLRFKLTAKKKLYDLHLNSEPSKEINKGCININMTQNTAETQENGSESDGENKNVLDEDEEYEQLPVLDISPLKRLAKPAVRTDRWYFVVDTNVLMSNLTFVNILVKSDPACRMMVPYQVHSELDSHASRQTSNRNAYNMARRASHYLSRELKSKASVIGQSAMKAVDLKINRTNGDDDIINCCLQLIEQDYHVILLTNDVILNTKAEASNIVSFSVKQIKDYLYSRQDEKSQYKITIQNKDTVKSTLNQWCFEKYISGYITDSNVNSTKVTQNYVTNKLSANQNEKNNTKIEKPPINLENKLNGVEDRNNRINTKKQILTRVAPVRTKTSQEKEAIVNGQKTCNIEKSNINMTVIHPSPVTSKPIKLKRTPLNLNCIDKKSNENVPKFRWRRKDQSIDIVASEAKTKKTIVFDKNDFEKNVNVSRIKFGITSNCNVNELPSKTFQTINKVNCPKKPNNLVQSTENIITKQLIIDSEKSNDMNLKTDSIFLKHKIKQVKFVDDNEINNYKPKEPKNNNNLNKEYLENLHISVNLFKGGKQVSVSNANSIKCKDNTVPKFNNTAKVSKVTNDLPQKEIGITQNDNIQTNLETSKPIEEKNVEVDNIPHKYSDIFDIKDEILGERLRSRSDEWVFRYCQIMEEVLSQLLQQNFSEILNSTMPPPWTIQEATECIKQVLSHKSKVVKAATKLSLTIFENSDKLTGNVLINIEPKAYMKLYNQGVGLIKSLKEVYPNNEDIGIGESLLSKLIIDIRDVNNSNYKYNIETTSIDNFMENASVVSLQNITPAKKLHENDNLMNGHVINKIINNIPPFDEPKVQNENQSPFKFIRTCNIDPSIFKSFKLNSIEENIINNKEDCIDKDQVDNLLQKILFQIKTTLLDVHHFCKSITIQLEEEIVSENIDLRCKVESVKSDTENIVDCLKRILRREAHGSDDSVNSLLSNSMLANNGLASKYREIIERCTVQANILLDTLNIIIKSL